MTCASSFLTAAAKIDEKKHTANPSLRLPGSALPSVWTKRSLGWPHHSEHLEPGARDADETITQLIAVLEMQDLARAIERLEKGHGLRVVK